MCGVDDCLSVSPYFFPRLFRVAVNKGAYVSECYVAKGGFFLECCLLGELCACLKWIMSLCSAFLLTFSFTGVLRTNVFGRSILLALSQLSPS